MPYANNIGNKRYWTRERILEGLRKAAAAIDGPLPCLDARYSTLKKGHMDWPVANRVLKEFHSMAAGWFAAGVERSRVTVRNIEWSAEEEEYVHERAGIDTLEQIADHLRRSRDALHRHLLEMGITARGNQGYFSAAEFCQEFDVSYSRLRRMLHNRQIGGRYDKVRNRWEIYPVLVTKAQWEELRTPKITHKNEPLDRGDWAHRYGIHRINGKRVKEAT